MGKASEGQDEVPNEYKVDRASLHVEFLHEHSRVGYLIDNIVNSDPDLRAVIVQVRVDRNGMRSQFEDTVTYILPVDPFVKKPSHDNRRNPQVSYAATLQNKSKSCIGVDLCWYKPDEYKKLNPVQKKELYEWQSTKEGQAIIAKQRAASGIPSKNQSVKKKLQAKIKSLEAQVQGNKQTLEYPTLFQLESLIASAVVTPSPAPAPVPIVATCQSHPSVSSAAL